MTASLAFKNLLWRSRYTTVGLVGQQAEGEDGEQEGEQHPDTQHNANPFGFPLSLIKRIMCLDPEVTRISGGQP